MADETTTTNNEGGQQPPAAPPQGNNAEVTKQLVQVTEQLTQAKAQLDALTKERDGLKTGLEQVTAKATDFEKRFNEATTTLQAKTGEVATLSTQLEQTLGKVNELTTTTANLTKQSELFKMIAETPDFHGMVGSFQTLSEVIKPDASPDAIKTLLGQMAKDNQTQITKALETFRAGGSPPANHAGDPAAGPKNKDEAWAAWQTALKSGDVAKQQAAYQIFNGFVNGENKQAA